MDSQNIGLGCSGFNIAVYISNKPNLDEYTTLNKIKPMTKGEINEIGLSCGNGWRKIFNVYSKVLYALDPNEFAFQSLAPTWQSYRDDILLQEGSSTALLFSSPVLNKDRRCIHIISGKTYANTLINNGKLADSLIWLDDSFALDMINRVIVCPYFDYRQLSNKKIEFLASLIGELTLGNSRKTKT